MQIVECMKIKERQFKNSSTESTLDPPYGEIQEILVLCKINNYRERYTTMQVIKSNLAISGNEN